ncbi:hypothetical protein K8T06_12450 [bacterium]|nr:hypothetical protein [bacterium]
MDKLLKEINSISGVVGSFVFSRKNGVMARQLPDFFKDQKLENLGTQLNRSFAIGKKNKAEMESFEIGFENSKILGHSIDPITCFYVFCEPSINMALLKMSLDVVCEDILEMVQNFTARPVEQQAPDPVQSPPIIKVKPKELMNSSAIGKELKILKHAFTIAVGPMAEIIMFRIMKKWLIAGNPDRSRIGELADLLQEQIDDVSALTDFKESIKAIL